MTRTFRRVWAKFFSGGPSSVRESYDDFACAEYDRALHRLTFEPLSASRLFLEALVLYWSGDRERCATVLQNELRLFAGRMSPDIAANATALHAAALAALGRSVEARERLAESANDAHDESIAYFRSAALMSLGEHDAARELLDRTDAIFGRNPYRAFLRGWIRAVHADLRGQIVECTDALALLERGTREVGLTARILRVLSALARETLDVRAIDAVEAHAGLAWTPSLAIERFQTLRTMAWAHALRGNHIRAGEDFSAAVSLASDPYHKMLAHLDRAWVAAASHEPVHHEIEVRQALRCAADVDVEASRGEEVGGVLYLAAQLAPIDVTSARSWFERARAASPGSSLSFAHGQRLDGYRLEAEAIVLRWEGRTRIAAHRAQDALAVFTTYGFQWRIANLALIMFHMSGEAKWLRYVESAAATYPRSFIAAQYERMKAAGRTPFETLTLRQREIVALIRDEGLTNENIAHRLRMSPNTVRIHKQRIYRSFGVSNEFQLLAKLHKLAS